MTKATVVVEAGEPRAIRAGGGSLPLAGSGEMTRLIFTGEPPAAVAHDDGARAAWQAVQPAFPVPLPDSGLNYV